MKNVKRYPAFLHRLAPLGMLCMLALPGTSTAMVPYSIDGGVSAADDPCKKASVQLEIDVDSGLVYYVDSQTGTWQVLSNAQLDVYLGGLEETVVWMHYSTGEWNVSVTTDNSTTTHQTNNGWLRYPVDDDYESYLFSSSQASSASTMTTMTPVVPDIVISVDVDCPPDT